MTTGSANTHANHDETLIVRLYGGDVDAQERAIALDRLAECSDCAGLFADLGQIASATAALRIPARPRDFSLTPQDAARLRPAKQARGATSWRGLTRRLGGAFAALGVAGILVTGAATALAPAASVTQQLASNTRDEAAIQVGAGGVPTSSGAGYAAVSPASSNATKAVAAGSPSPVQNGLGSVALGSSAPGPLASAAPVAPPHSASSATTLAVVPQPATSGQSNSVAGQGLTPGQPTSGGSVDARLALLIGSGGLLLMGLLLILGPRLRGRGLRS
jgi:hypothetical protein